MSNIHRINDPLNQYHNIPQSNNSLLLPFQNTQSTQNPRTQTFFGMIKEFCCPDFKLIKFIVIISIIQTFYFFLSVFISKSLGPIFLEPDSETLILMGAKETNKMQNGQIWRFITPIFLHANFMHFLTNILSQLIFGLGIESLIGIGKMSIIYFCSGFGGNLLSGLMNNNVGVGASTSIFGVLGAFIGFIIVNWNALERIRATYLCFIGFFLFFSFLSGGLGTKDLIDNYGHLGGLLTGFLLGLILIKSQIESNKKIKMFGWIGISCFFIIGFICFFAVKEKLE